ncbi:MAG: peptide deformylase [Oscillospiraceae bacterium]|jgi:peptide deformylase|nr:peptide deformylase [Oscillospiraceae bacterium]
MALRNILRDGEKSLLKTSRAVTDYNARLHQLIDDMRETLIEAEGLGLAAPQVGVLRRVVIVVDTSREGTVEDQMIELVNPEIIARSGEQVGHEGCLSVPEVYGIVERPQLVKIRAFDRNGEMFEIYGEGLTARAFCHEIDHLNGVLFTSLATRFLTADELEELRKTERP